VSRTTFDFCETVSQCIVLSGVLNSKLFAYWQHWSVSSGLSSTLLQCFFSIFHHWLSNLRASLRNQNCRQSRWWSLTAARLLYVIMFDFLCLLFDRKHYLAISAVMCLHSCNDILAECINATECTECEDAINDKLVHVFRIRWYCPATVIADYNKMLSYIAERPCCRVRCSFGQKWKTGTRRHYFADIIGLSSTTVI